MVFPGIWQGAWMSEELRGPLRVAEFGFPGKQRDRLVAAILDSKKTATTGLLVEWELACEPIPRAGERFLVVDSSEAPVAIIEVQDVRVMPLADVDIAVAHDEGEGFRTVAEWRRAHEAFWARYADELRTRLDDPAWRLVDQTPVVVERFRLIDRLDT
jgi:uncharacterized protein YhfF